VCVHLKIEYMHNKEEICIYAEAFASAHMHTRARGTDTQKI